MKFVHIFKRKCLYSPIESYSSSVRQRCNIFVKNFQRVAINYTWKCYYLCISP